MNYNVDINWFCIKKENNDISGNYVCQTELDNVSADTLQLLFTIPEITVVNTYRGNENTYRVQAEVTSGRSLDLILEELLNKL